VSVAVLAVYALGSAEGTQIDPSTNLPSKDSENVHKGVCVTYTIGDVTTQVAVPYPNAMTYHVIGNSGGYWIYFQSGERLRVDSFEFGPLYQLPGSEGLPDSCTPPE
jgi:hypothetical protein